MAGIFVWNNARQYNSELVNKAFVLLDYNKGEYLPMGEWSVVVFQKTSYEIKNWKIYPGGSVCGVGTFAYKGKVYEKALPLIYNDFTNNRLEKAAFWGSFIIVLFFNGELTIIRDGAGLTRLYSFNNLVYSTSFAGIINCSETKFNIDKRSVTELLITGVLVGADTLLKEIKRINIGCSISQINIIESESVKYNLPKSRKDAISQQVEIAKGFFKKLTSDWFDYMPDSKLDIGVTGGLDSRLIAALALGSASKVELHTHWRKNQMQNKDFRFAHVFAKTTGLKLNIKKVSSSISMSTEQIENNFMQAYCLSDGVIRPGCYWDEEYSTSQYRAKLTDPPFLRLMGFGGEQYRNGERLPTKSIRTLESWIKWEMNYQYTGRYFISEESAKDIEKHIEQKMISQFGQISFSLKSYKDYIRFVQSPSYRSLQAQMDNRHGFCINPFLDINLATPSSMAIPFLGKSLNFQLKMVSQISPSLAAIPNAYGFDFTKGEPFWLAVGAVAWQYLPPLLKHPVYSSFKKHYFSNFIPILAQKHKFIRDLECYVKELKLPVDFTKYRTVRSRSRLLLNLGYFIKMNANQLKL